MFFAKFIDSMTLKIQHVTSVLSISLALLTTWVVLARYVFSGGSIALQESALYIHATIFLLGCSVALKNSAHVRVDIFYRRMNQCAQNWLDLIGHITLLLPLCCFIFYISWDYVVSSWQIKESSADAGGLPFVYLLKSLMPLAAGCLALQATAEAAKALSNLLEAGK